MKIQLLENFVGTLNGFLRYENFNMIMFVNEEMIEIPKLKK